MKQKTKKALKRYFEQEKNGIWSTTELAKILREHASAWDAWDVSGRKAALYLEEAGILQRTEFTSSRYRPFTRYFRGNVSPYKMGLSLKPSAYLCQQSALAIHDLQPPSRQIYANQEQTPKGEPGGVSQEGMTKAFKRKQRHTNFIFKREDYAFVLISGKSTHQAGVDTVRFGEEELRVTDLERTLIDIVVRPAYAGGIEQVAHAYRRAASRVNIEYLLSLLQQIGHAYPYHQAIGFLLERSGVMPSALSPLRSLGIELDFYLDYAMKRAEYDDHWGIYFPKSISQA